MDKARLYAAILEANLLASSALTVVSVVDVASSESVVSSSSSSSICSASKFSFVSKPKSNIRFLILLGFGLRLSSAELVTIDFVASSPSVESVQDSTSSSSSSHTLPMAS